MHWINDTQPNPNDFPDPVEYHYFWKLKTIEPEEKVAVYYAMTGLTPTEDEIKKDLIDKVNQLRDNLDPNDREDLDSIVIYGISKKQMTL